MSVVDLMSTAPVTAIAVREVDPVLAMAMEKGLPVESLERIVALVHKQEERRAERAFYDALAQFQAECPQIPKSSRATIATRTGTGYGYSYAELDEIDATVKGPAHRHGLSWTWDTDVDDKGMLTVLCHIRHRDGHAAPPTRLKLPTSTSSAMSDQQRFGAAMTFGQRRTLLAALGMPTTDATPDAPAEMEPITPEQAANLAAMLDELPEERRAGFMRYVGVEHLADIPAGRYGEYVAALEKARKAGAK